MAVNTTDKRDVSLGDGGTQGDDVGTVSAEGLGQTIRLKSGESNAFTTKFDELIAWARKYSLFQYPFATACCGMEFMQTASPCNDIARFGAEAPRFSPRQADVLWVVGTISQRQGPVLKRIYEQMTEPKWVVSFGTCAACGGFYDNYTTIPGVDKIIPVDVYIPGCPPRPEAVLDALMLLQEKIQAGSSEPIVVPPREVPKLAQIRPKVRREEGRTAVYPEGTVIRAGVNAQPEAAESSTETVSSAS